MPLLIFHLQGLDKTVRDAARDLQDEFQDNIYDKYEAAISAAINESSDTALHWGLKVNREDRSAGGICWVCLLCRNEDLQC